MRLAGKKIGIVGAGQVGAGWAIVFARAGAQVAIFDGSAETVAGLPGFFDASLAAMARHGLVDDPKAIIARLRIVETLEAAVAGADYIQESVFERLDVKIDIARQISSAMRGGAEICGSSTSGFPGSAFTTNLANASRFLVVHPVNPPHLIPVVEIVPTPATAPEVVTAVRALIGQAGQAPVVLTREIDGFILNRLQGALLDEAWKLFEEGYASVADIDATVSQGLGLRWSFMGPFETIDLNAPDGIDDYCARLAPMYQLLASRRDAGAQIWTDAVVAKAKAARRDMLPAEDLAARRAWRDERLMALLAFKRVATK